MDFKYDKRIRAQKEREIYRPGSGPLKRTDPLEIKGFINKSDYYEKPEHAKSDREEFLSTTIRFDNSEYLKYQTEKKVDKDKKKLRKPDVSIYVPKQRSKINNSTQNVDTSEFNSPYSSSDFTFENRTDQKPLLLKERFSSRDIEFNNKKQEINYDQSKIHLESKQYFSGCRNDISHNWKELIKDVSDFRKTDNRDIYDANFGKKNSCQNSSCNNIEKNAICQNEHKTSNFYNRYGNEKNDRGNNGDKNRIGRNLSRRNSSTSLVLPDAFNSWPPRLQKQFLESKGLNPDELDKYLKNKNSFSTNNQNRDYRFSQTLPSKNNRNTHFKSNKVKDAPKNNRVSQKFSKCLNNVNSDQISHHSQEKLNNPIKDVSSPVEKLSSFNSNESIYDNEAGISVKSDIVSDCKSNETDTKISLHDDNEVFNWAEEVEREQQNAERNYSETDERRKSDVNTNGEKRDRKKRRSKREFRKKRGFSYERKNSQRNGNQSENENQSAKKEDDHFKQNDSRPYKERDSETSNSDTYLSWRRNKNPSPPRTRLGIMNRSYRLDNKFDNIRTNLNELERINIKMKNSRLSNLPLVVKEQASLNKDSIAGIIKIPQPRTDQEELKCSPPVFPVPHFSAFSSKPIKQLYNPTNPKHPIIVSSQSARTAISSVQPPISSNYTPPNISEHINQIYAPTYMDPSVAAIVAPAYLAEQHMMSKPAWYDAYSESFRSTHNAHLLLDISRADTELQALLLPSTIIPAWERITSLRVFLQDALKTLLTSDLKFCEAENVEQHMWKILFYNVIELLRKCIIEEAVNSQKFKSLLFSVIDKGMEYFRSLLVLLERTYKIKIDDYCSAEPVVTKPSGFGSLALVSGQKIFLFLGDLARYKETTEESSTYTNARQWYIKANQLNPRNGRPYNQLAILAVYARRKFDAVYYYMRSLMASNPFFTARDSLLALFDDNRKKYEQIEKNRRELKEIRKQEKAKEKESVINGSMLRKEIWIRPDDGRRIQRTTSTSQDCTDGSDDEELSKISAGEVNKRFLLSFLHVHGKLYSKVGMETLQEAAIEMLKEFKILLNHSPLPINTTRLLQLLALNMFAIDNGQLKDPQIETGYHSAIQESALVISLQMFNLIINRCIQLLRDQLQQMKNHPEHIDWHYPLIVSADVQILLPAIKLWCDWLFCHSAVWNPPPSCQDYRISGCGNCWSKLAVLINILEELDYQNILAKNGFNEPILIMSDEKHDMVKIILEEEVTLRGFTPLMCNAQQPVYTHKNIETELAQICLRIHRILFFGTIFLCGIDPPVLKLQKTESGLSEYISVVEEVVTPKDQSDNENIYERWSENEEGNENCNEELENNLRGQFSSEEKSLLLRKKELERIHQKREKYMRDKKETISKDIAAVSIEMEIKPYYLIPDTNCFIDCLPELEKIAKAVSSTQRPLYLLLVPVIVLGELEGIAKGIQKNEKVSERARYALNFLQNKSCYNTKCVTTRGSIVGSTRFTSEEECNKVEKNDDKILNACLNLCKNYTPDNSNTEIPKKIYREVVLLTEDRNLRVKALSSNMPVQTVSDFVKWAGLN